MSCKGAIVLLYTVWRVIFGGSNFREKSTYALRINFRGFNFRDCMHCMHCTSTNPRRCANDNRDRVSDDVIVIV